MTKLTVTTTVHAPLEFVWDAMWNPIHIIHWGFADGTTWHCPWARGESPKVGGIFTTRMEARDGSFGFDLTAQYTKVEPMKSMSYTLGEMKEYFLDAGRVVDITFEETPEGVKITETFDAEAIHSEEQQIGGWQMILENFRGYVEGVSRE
ncbi:MAG: SRPBCC domain-containing protein [Candidatus Gracilibacteria bacterium]|nr:SRPBCC domain-containing protein [Candidatus Gracilibacteria bacterium]